MRMLAGCTDSACVDKLVSAARGALRSSSEVEQRGQRAACGLVLVAHLQIEREVAQHAPAQRAVDAPRGEAGLQRQPVPLAGRKRYEMGDDAQPHAARGSD